MIRPHFLLTEGVVFILEKGVYTMKKTKCECCEDHRSIKTDSISPDKSFIENPEHSKVLIIKNDKNEYIFSVNYCPFCGKKLIV